MFGFDDFKHTLLFFYPQVNVFYRFNLSELHGYVNRVYRLAPHYCINLAICATLFNVRFAYK